MAITRTTKHLVNTTRELLLEGNIADIYKYLLKVLPGLVEEYFKKNLRHHPDPGELREDIHLYTSYLKDFKSWEETSVFEINEILSGFNALTNEHYAMYNGKYPNIDEPEDGAMNEEDRERINSFREMIFSAMDNGLKITEEEFEELWKKSAND